jgi:hypothetical protein
MVVRPAFQKHYQIYSIPAHIQNEYPDFAERWEKTVGKNKNAQKELTKENIEYFAKMDLWSVEEAIYLCHEQRPIHRRTDTEIWENIVVPFHLKEGKPPIGILFQYEVDDPNSELGQMLSFAIKAIQADVLKPKVVSLSSSVEDADYLFAQVVPLDFMSWAREKNLPVHRRVIKATEAILSFF